MKTYQIRINQGGLELEVKSEDKAFVESQVKQFFFGTQEPKEKRMRGTSAKVERPASTTGKPLSIAEFKKVAAPQSGPEHVACVAYYFEKHQGASEFRTKELLAGLKDIRLNVKNPSDTILKAKGAGYLMPGKTPGTLMLSSSGEKRVEELIDRAKKQSN